MFNSTYQRRLFITLLMMGVLFPGVAWYGLSAMSTIRTSPTTWVPETFQKRREYYWFERTFETNDAVVISWDDCTLDDPRLEKLYQALHKPDDTPDGNLLREYVDRVITGKTLLEAMQDYPLELSESTAKERLEEALIGSDGETTCCIVLLTDLGGVERKKTVPLLVRTAEEKAGVPEDEQRLVGPVYDAYSIDVESVKSMRTFIVPSMLVVMILCRVCLRSWAYTILVFTIAVFGELTTLALVYTGDQLFQFGPMNAVLIVMPPLVMVLTVSAAVHLVNYYHDEVRRSGFENAPRKALKNGLMPCALATTTTAIGLLSLLLSDIIPVKLFGVYATCGIGTTLILLVLTLPGAQERWPVSPREGRESIFKDLSGISNFVCRYPISIALICLAIMLTCGYGLQYMRTSVNVRSLFTSDSRILNDYQWFEKNIGPMTPVEVVLHFEKRADDEGQAQQLDKLEQLEIVDQMQRAVASIDEIHGTMSAATFYRSIPRRFSQRAGMARRLRRDVQVFDDINYTAIFDHYVLLAPGESIRIEGLELNDVDALTVEGFTGPVNAEAEDEEGWVIVPWDDREHFAYVFSGDQVRMFQDGQQVEDANQAKLPTVSITDDGAVEFSNGLDDSPLGLDVLTLWRGARYWRNFSPPTRWDRTEDTISLFQFGEVEGDQVQDDVGLHTIALQESQKAKRRYDEEHWRIGGRVAAIGDPNKPELDYGEFLAEIQQQIDPRLWAVHYMETDIRPLLQGLNLEEAAQQKVLLVGVGKETLPKPTSRTDESEEEEEGEEDSAPAEEPAPEFNYDSKDEKSAAIFAYQLAKLLIARGIERENIATINVGETPSDEQLASANLVVYIRDVSGVSWKEVSGEDVDAVDARHHPVILDPDDPADTRIVSATYTGVMPLAYEVQNALLNDLIKSFLSAVALVSVVMIVLQRSPIAGLVAMIPNVFPMVLLFGITSGLGMAIDIGTVMTASVALGIAVDDTLHFLTWFNREHSETGDHKAGVRLAFRHCAKAMLQTTLICSMGLVIYSFSWFMPTRRFSWMMVSLLMAAVIGDLVFLPSILAGPIGRLFPMRKLILDPLAKNDAPPSVEATAEKPAAESSS